MSNQERMPAGLTSMVECCAPLARQPLSPAQAVELSQVFKAMGDRVRLRLLSLIASHEGGEVCVCGLSGVFDLDRSDDLPPPQGAAESRVDLRRAAGDLGLLPAAT
jgi:hypothetical protein